MKFGYDSYTKALYTKGKTQARGAEQPDGSGLDQRRADKISSLHGRNAAQSCERPKKPMRCSVLANYYDFAYQAAVAGWLGWVRRKHRR